jgi:hypothetical protein
MTQNNLGAALHKLGERREEPQLLAQAVDAYEHAIQEWTRERTPMHWAMTKANLGVARKILAQKTGEIGVARMAMADLEGALETFRTASHARYFELVQEQLAEARAVLKELDAPSP